MLKERTFSTGGLSINYAVGPASGPPLVLLHGLPGRWQEFTAVLPALTQGWQVYALDSRGQGKSGWTPGQYAAIYYLDDLGAFLQGQVGVPAVLFGASAGGVVALSAAARHPERVRGVIVGDSPVDMPVLVAWMTSEGFKSYFSILRDIAGRKGASLAEISTAVAGIPTGVDEDGVTVTYAESPGVDAVEIQELAMTLMEMDPDVLEYHAEGRADEFLAGFDLEEILHKIKCPILLLQANPSLGGMMTDRAVSMVESIVPDVIHIRMENTGHDLGLETWDTGPLLRAVMSFLQGIDL